MHEEPYAQAILDMVLEKADGRSVKSILLGVGRFSAIVPTSLEVFFYHLSRNTVAAKASLVFETVPLALTCNSCKATQTLDIPDDIPVQPALAAALKKGCPCGEKRLSVTNGLKVDLVQIEVN